MTQPIVLAWGGADAAASRLAARLGATVGAVEHRRFPDRECYLRLQQEVAGRAAVVVAHLQPPDETAMGLMFLAGALREQGASRVGLVLPYLPYMRQDTQFRAGEAFSSRTFAGWLWGWVDWLVTVDPHLHRLSSLDEIFSVPTRVVPSAPAVADWVRAHVPEPVLLGPDDESAQWVAAVAARIGCPWRVMHKQRLGDREVQMALPPLADLAARTPVLLDDIISSGQTMAQAVRQLRAAGLPAAVCIAVHGVFAEGAWPLLQAAGAARVLTCNTLPGPGEQIDVLPAIAAAVAQLQA
jgi:ribose-phosphate pyrophosphokinase